MQTDTFIDPPKGNSGVTFTAGTCVTQNRPTTYTKCEVDTF